MLVSIIKSDKRFGRYKPVIVVVCVELLHEPIDSIRPFLQPLLPADIERYEKRSTIITTNKPFGKWAETFGDPVMTNAILDRLLHHCKVFKIVGRSYRTKDVDFGTAEPLGVHIDKEKNSERKED